MISAELITDESVKISKTIDSREIAEMLGIKHYILLREIDGSKDGKTVGLVPTLKNANFVLSKYFIEDEYYAGKRKYKCYKVTKLGCELIGNKQQGEKGILFSAKYVERFNQLEKAFLEKSMYAKYSLPRNYKEALAKLIEAEEEKEKLLVDIKEKDITLEAQAPKVEIYEDFLSRENLYSVNNIAKVLAIKGLGRNNLYKYLRVNKIFMDDYEAYQQYINEGKVIHRERRYTYNKKVRKENPRASKGYEYKYEKVQTFEIVAYFTPKGVEWLCKKLKKDGYVSNKNIDAIMDELKNNKDMS